MKNLRHVVRQLLRTPTFTVVAVLTLALGIGANSAIFSLVDAVLLRPLPYPDAENLVTVWHEAPGMGIPQFEISEGSYLLFEGASPMVEKLAVWDSRPMNLAAGDGSPERILGVRGTEALLPTLGVAPLFGRGFTEDDTRPGAPPVALIGEALWRSHFGHAADVVGRTVELDGTRHEIVGVLPARSSFPSPEVRVWIPYPLDRAAPMVTAFRLGAVARLAPGADPAAVAEELGARFDTLPDVYPGEMTHEGMQNAGMGVRVIPLSRDLVGDVAPVLWVLLATVGFVLLIACANVANLFLVRAEGRQREIALRRALGAGGFEVVRLHLLESGVVAALGGLGGLALAAVGLRLLVAASPESIPRLWEVGVDARTLLFTALLSLVGALALGLLPVLRHRTLDLVTALKAGAGSASPGGHRTRYLLVGSQVALALVLLIGSGLLVRTFWSLRQVDPGFSAEQALTLRLSLPETSYAEQADVSRFVTTLLDELESVPGVVGAGATNVLPLVSRGAQFGVRVEDFPPEPGDLAESHPVRLVSPGYFETLGIPLLAGRGFDRSGAGDDAAVLVSEAFARRYWAEDSALGRRVRLGGTPEVWFTIEGIVGSVLEGSLQESPAQTVYFPTTHPNPMLAANTRGISVALRTSVIPESVLPQVRERIRALDPTLPIAEIRSMERIAADSMARNSFSAALLGLAALVALLLGCVGVYGVIAYVVGRRRREFAIRLALGARGVERLVLRQALAVVGAGAAVGLLGAFALSRLLETLLFGVAARDPWTFVVATLLLVGAATLASYSPARQAGRVDPAKALRAD